MPYGYGVFHKTPYGRHQYLRFEGLKYTDADIADFEERLGKIYGRGVHRVQVFNFRGLTDLMTEGLSSRMLMEHRDAQGQSVFTSRAWRRLFEVRGLLLGGARRRMSWREFIFGMGLHTAEEMESTGFEGDFLSTTPSYTMIKDPILRLCHRLIACSITGRSQALKKVFEEIFFGEEAWRLDILGIVAEGAPDIDEGPQAVPVPIQAPQPPPAAGPARTLPQRVARLEEE
ncbi:hypothetical protein Tco_1520672, partial [Tanacetum coccineum]